jgi:hypothetical protein
VRVLEGQRVQLDQLGELGQVVVAGTLVVDPDEATVGQFRGDLVVLRVVQARNPYRLRTLGVRFACGHAAYATNRS